LLLLVAVSFLPARADSTRPVVGPGATRDEVIEAYGWPSGQSQSAGREIFTYPQGRIVLQNGVVERMDFSPNVTWAKPKPRPAPAAPTTKPPVVAPSAMPARPMVDPWVTDFAAALREAAARGCHVLALFTGTDWSPPAKRFQSEVALHPAFLDAVMGDFVLLKLDFPTHTALRDDLRRQNAALRERFDVTTYPTLIVLSASGEEISRVNLAKARPEPTYRDQVVAAIAEARPTPPRSAGAVGAGTAATAAARSRVIPGRELNRWVLGGAVGLLLVCWYLVRRRSPVEQPNTPGVTLPTPAEIAGWSHNKVREVSAGLFEYEGWRVQLRTADTGADLALRHDPAARPEVLVGCQAAGGGLAGARTLRNLFATAVAEGVPTIWFVSPGGFTPEARAFAAEQQVALVDGEALLQRLKPLPALALIRVLTTATSA
jgi:hypothetical protein